MFVLRCFHDVLDEEYFSHLRFCDLLYIYYTIKYVFCQEHFFENMKVYKGISAFCGMICIRYSIKFDSDENIPLTF